MSSRASALVLFALLVACSEAEHHSPYESKLGAPPRTPAPLDEPIVVEPSPGVTPDGDIIFAVDWFEGSFEEARTMAADQNKLLFVDVGAYWCPPCHELDEKVFTDTRVAAWLREHAIALHIDAEKGEGPELVERYAVQAYPTMLLLEGSGVEKTRLVDFHEPEALVELLAEAAEGGNVLADLVAKVEEAPDDLEARYALANAHALAAQREEAEAQYALVLAGDPDNELGLASKVLSDRATFFVYKLDANPEGAIEALEALQKRFPESKEAIRAHRTIGRAHCKQGREDRAIEALQAMVATDPDDPALKASFGWFAFREKCGPRAALAAVLAGIAQAPQDADLRYVEAELQHILGQPDLALAAIEKAAELEPKSAYYKRQVRRFAALVEDVSAAGSDETDTSD